MASGISFSGIGSGIDGQAIAKSLFDQLTLSNQVRNNKISNLETTNSSLDKLRTLLLSVSDKLDGLRSANGSAGAKVVSTSDSKIVSAAANGEATASSVSLNVTSIANSASGSFDRGFATGSEFIVGDSAASGNVNFAVGTGDNQKNFSVAVDETTTAQDFVNAFNTQANGAASASLINIGTTENPNYKISFKTSALGTEQGSLSLSVDNSLLSQSNALSSTTIEQATNAKFSVSGVTGTIERASNSISDVITGVTLQLSGTGSATISVKDDLNKSASQLESFIGAYNDLVKFVNKEDAVIVSQDKSGTKNIFGALSGTNVDENALGALRGAISGTRSADGSTSLATLGLSTDRDGTISFDRKKFDAAFAANPEVVNQTITSLADRVSGIQGVIQGFVGYGNAIDQTLKSNNSQISNLKETVAKVERNASKQQEAIQKQFNALEVLIAKLNQNSSALTALLKF